MMISPLIFLCSLGLMFLAGWQVGKGRSRYKPEPLTLPHHHKDCLPPGVNVVNRDGANIRAATPEEWRCAEGCPQNDWLVSRTHVPQLPPAKLLPRKDR